MRHRGSDSTLDNVLLDLGFPDAEELTAKAMLAKKINDLLDSRDLTQSMLRQCSACRSPKSRRSGIIS